VSAYALAEDIRHIDNDWELCGQIARTHGRTFHLASQFLPGERRRAIHAVYAFCRTADDIVDKAACPVSAGNQLDTWESQLDRPVDPVARAFWAARETFGIPLLPARQLIAGVRTDLGPVTFETWEDLRAYCYSVAGTVGLMVSPVLGGNRPDILDHAATLGIAMQLTNILRDIAEDARLGRLYLPLDELAQFGCDAESVLSGNPTGDFSGFMRFQIDRARALFAYAERGTAGLIPTGRFTTLAASRMYAGILGKIEANGYDVFSSRARVSTTRKVSMLPGVWTAFVQVSVRNGRYL
jgi:phytoene synthase